MDPITTFIFTYFFALFFNIGIYCKKNVTPNFVSWVMLIVPIVNFIPLFYYFLGGGMKITIKSMKITIKSIWNDFITYFEEIKP